MKDLEHLKSKRYWALILLGPPLRAIFAFAIFAALHLGLGLPWPTREDAGLLLSLLEMFGLLLLVGVVDHLVIRMVYGSKGPGEESSRLYGHEVMIGMLAGMLTMVAGYAGAIMVARYFDLQPAVDLDNGFIVLLVVILTTIHNAEEVWRAERRQRREFDVAEETGA